MITAPTRRAPDRLSPHRIAISTSARARRLRRWPFLSNEVLQGFRACGEGAAILEFAIVLPLAVGILAGSFEIGRALHTTLTVERAVRAGARYLARVRDPTCVPACSRGARRAIELARDQILSSTGLAADAVSVSIVEDGAARVVVLKADARMDLVLLQNAGLPASWTITASHQEQQVAE